MQKLWIALGVIVALLVGAVLVGPSFVDWNRFKSDIASAAERATGRRLDIGGDLSLSLLPRATLTAEQVRLANVPGAPEPDMVSVDAVRIRLDLGALLQGQIAIESVVLDRPVVLLEKPPEGVANWVFTDTATAADSEGVRAGGSVPGNGETPDNRVDLRLEQVRVTGGTVIYRDLSEGGLETAVHDLDLTLAAETLRGPFQAEGSFTAEGHPVRLTGSLGAITAGRSAPLSVVVSLSDSAAEAKLSGLLADAETAPALQGQLVLTAPDPARALAAAGVHLPPSLNRPLAVSGQMSATAERTALSEMTIELGPARASGHLAYDTVEAGQPRLDVALAFTAIDLDAWGQAPPASAPSTAEGSPAGAPTMPQDASVPDAPWRFTLPPDLTALVDVTAQAVTWRGEVMRQAVVNAALSESVVSLNQVSVQIPGNGRLAAYGLVTTPDGVPTVDLSLEGRADNLRSTLTWLGVDVSRVPATRLHRLTLSGGLNGTPEDLQIPDLEATVDTTTLRGAAVLRPGPRPAIGATVEIGALTLDAYLPQPGDEPAQPVAGGAAPTPQEPAPAFAGLGVLNDIDANLRGHIETLTWHGVPFYDVSLDASLQNGAVSIRDTRIGDVAGASMELSGGLSGFGGAPRVDGLTAAAVIPDVARLGRAFSIDVPPALVRLQPLDLQATVTGSPETLEVSTTDAFGSGVLRADGTITDPLGAVGVDLTVSATHPDLPALLRALGSDYRPRGPLGPVSLDGRVSGGGGTVTVSDLVASLGADRITGNGSVDFARPLPLVTATLAADTFAIDQWRPAEQQAALTPQLIPAAWTPTLAAAPWTSKPVALGWLGAVDADLTLTAGTVTGGGATLSTVSTRAALRDARLRLEPFAATLNGGALTGVATLMGGETPQWSLSADLKNADLAALLRDLSGEAPASGRLSMTAELTATGPSTAAWARSLDGGGTLAIDRLDPAGKAGGAASALLGPVKALDDLAGMGKTAPGLARMDGTYVVDDGLVTLQDLTLSSALYTGRFGGVVSLPAWTVDVSGTAKLAPTLLSTLLGGKLKLPDTIPVEVQGPLDAPVVRVLTGRAKAGPEADKEQKPAPAVDIPQELPKTPEEGFKALEGLIEQFRGR